MLVDQVLLDQGGEACSYFQVPADPGLPSVQPQLDPEVVAQALSQAQGQLAEPGGAVHQMGSSWG